MKKIIIKEVIRRNGFGYKKPKEMRLELIRCIDENIGRIYGITMTDFDTIAKENTLSTGLSLFYDIKELLKIAYDAGKEGYELELIAEVV